MVQKSTLPLLHSMKKFKGENFAEFIEHLRDETVDDLCECVFNVINTDIKLSKAKKNALKRHIKKNCSVKRLKKISDKTVPLFKRKKALKMEGKGLPLILASVIPFLTKLFL